MKKILCLFYREPHPDGYYNTYKHRFFSETCKKNFTTKILSYEKFKNNTPIPPKDYPNLLKRIWHLVTKKTSLRLSYYNSKSFTEKYLQLIDTFKPDVIYVEHLVMMQFVFLKTNGAKVIFYNDESVLFQKKYNLIKGLRENIKNYYLDKFEKKSLEKSNLVLTITDEERNFLRELTERKVETIGWPIELSGFKFISYYKHRNDKFEVLFIGNFVHAPNRVAVELIVKKIYPNFVNNENIIFTIIGINTKKIKKIIPQKIRLFDNVPDVRVYLRRANLLIAPIFSGGGMRIKVLEAAAVGIPLLLSPIANFGYNFIKGKESFIANNCDEFVRQIKLIAIKHPRELDKITVNARKKVENKFQPNYLTKQLIKFINSV